MIEIPGYRIVRQLGRGGMATVYLAIQQSVDREVALKIMNPALLADSNFGDRFLREARIAAKLHHRHVVGVHDVGKHGDLHYIAMEFLSGGPILGKDGQPSGVVFALRIVREIATALGYANAKGFVHRDVKPDNIILRHDGSAALTDFGIARASDSATRMTRTGAVIGTPHYMSPEQARGRTVDGRADLYSLGIVLYELLLGRVPFNAEDSLAVGIMHITEAPPRLPEALSALEPMMDVMLAKKPEERYQTGEEMANAIREYEVAIARGELPSLVDISREQGAELLANLPTALLPPRERAIPIAAPPAPDARGQRADPQMGELSSIADEDRPRRAPPPPRSGAGRWLIMMVAVLGLGAAAAAIWINQDKLRDLLPDTELNSLLVQADQALSAGQLGGSEGKSALELYRAVLRQDQDNTQALTGVREVGNRLLVQARKALDDGDLDRARARAAEARDVLQGGAALDEIERALAERASRTTAIDALLEQAIAARDAGRLTDGEDSAAALFTRALASDPQSAIAQNGLDDIAAALALRGRELLAAGKLDEAEAVAAQIDAVRVGHAAVPELRAQVADARSRAAQAIENLLISGEAQLRAGALQAPANANARASFEQVLASDPQNARARAGISRVAAALLLAANAAIAARDVDAADRLLRQAQALGSPAGEVKLLRSRAREVRERIEIAAQRTALTSEQTTKLEGFLREADAALASGALNEPPGGNAYDLYRAALSLDRDNARAKAGLAAIAPRARILFDAALADRRPSAARIYLDAFADTARDTASKAAMGLALANAYAAQGERQLAAGQRDPATRSLQRAREFAADDPAVRALAAKLAGS